MKKKIREMITFRIGAEELRFNNEICKQYRPVKNIVASDEKSPVKTCDYVGGMTVVLLVFLDKYVIIQFGEIK